MLYLLSLFCFFVTLAKLLLQVEKQIVLSSRSTSNKLISINQHSSTCTHTPLHTHGLLDDTPSLLSPLMCGLGSKFLGSFMLIPISISEVNKLLQLRLMRLYHEEGSSEVGWGVRMDDSVPFLLC